MKKLALISSFCNDNNKKKVLISNISKLKNLNFDILLLSPIPLDEEIIKYCDYFFYTKDNPVYEWPIRGWNFWKTFFLDEKHLKISKTVSDYGWASLNQIKQLNTISLGLNYDYFYHIIYDLKIDTIVEKFLMEPENKMVFPSKRGDSFWKTGLHLMIFNKKNLEIFNNYITEESYNSIETHESVFDWLEKITKIIPLHISDTPVEDEIYFYDNKDIFNYSPIKGISFFIDKNDKTLDSIKILFYNVENQNLKLIIPQSQIVEFIKHDCIIDLGFNKLDMKQVLLEENDITIDITQIISEVKHNTLEFL